MVGWREDDRIFVTVQVQSKPHHWHSSLNNPPEASVNDEAAAAEDGAMEVDGTGRVDGSVWVGGAGDL